jgi:hypothetical protein
VLQHALAGLPRQYASEIGLNSEFKLIDENGFHRREVVLLVK